MLQRIHAAIMAVHTALTALTLMVTGLPKLLFDNVREALTSADIAGLHTKLDRMEVRMGRIEALHLAEPATQSGALPRFLEPGVMGLGLSTVTSITTGGQTGTLQNQGDGGGDGGGANASQVDRGDAPAADDEAVAGQGSDAAVPPEQPDPLAPGQQAA